MSAAVCRVCGCTEDDPCISNIPEDHGVITCAWAEPGLCSFCAIRLPMEGADDDDNALPGQDDEPLVRLYTEGEANAAIRAMSAGGAL